jgi:hypothetical protein
MPRNRSQKSPVSTPSTKRPSPTGLLQMVGSPRSPDVREEDSVRARQAALGDLVGLILVGPSNVFPIKPPTAQALFGLAIDRLAEHDKTTADALRRYAAQHARLELLDFRISTGGPSLDGAGVAKLERLLLTLEWLLSKPLTSAEDLQDDFGRYSRAVGKRICHLRTLRRQDELLRGYGRTHSYPVGTAARRAQRPAWVHQHLRAMIAEAQVVPCWHSERDLTDEEVDNLLNDVDERTSIARLSALVLTLLHPTTIDYLLKRLLPRRRQ